MSSFFVRIVAFVSGLLLLGSYDGLTQGYNSEQGRFTVNQVRGCAPLEIIVVDENRPPGNTSNPIYKYSYDGDLAKVFVDTDQKSEQDTTYRDPGTYKILQVIGDVLDTITIEVLEPRPPQFRVFNCINNGILLEINDDYYDRLSIDFGDGTFATQVATSQPSILHQYALQGEYTVTVQGIFDNADSQNCSVVDTTLTTINDLTIANITSVSVESNQAVRVRYQLPNSDVSYRLEVAEEGRDDFSFARFNLDNDNELLIDDLDVDFREQIYCFRIVAVNRCDETQNLPSETLCSIALQGEAQDAQNQLTWQTNFTSEYQVLRDGNPLIVTPDTEFLDTEVDCQQDYQYRVLSERPEGAIT